MFACILYFQIDVRIQDEDLRARKFFHHVSFSRVLRECEARLVEDYIPYLQGECRQMIKDENRTGSFIFGLLLLHRKALVLYPRRGQGIAVEQLWLSWLVHGFQSKSSPVQSSVT